MACLRRSTADRYENSVAFDQTGIHSARAWKHVYEDKAVLNIYQTTKPTIYLA